MKRIFPACLLILFCLPIALFAQIPTARLVEIVRAEDERRFDRTIENLLASPDQNTRRRAALAAGRIGDERAVAPLVKLLQNDPSNEVRGRAAFALGETESAQATPAVIEVLNNPQIPKEIRSRALEAAGKIAAANPQHAQTKLLGETMLKALDSEFKKKSDPDTDLILLGLTAVLRARPAGGDEIVRNFLSYTDPRIRADALNTLARLRAKNANRDARDLLQSDVHPVVRANAARVLSAAEDKDALDLLLKAAASDPDSRVRVSAIAALANLKDARAASTLLARGEKLLGEYASFKTTYIYPKEKNELLVIVTALSRVLPNTNNQKAVDFLTAYGKIEGYQSPEIEIALARIAPAKFSELQRNKNDRAKSDWRAINAMFGGAGELAAAPDSPEINPVKDHAKRATADYIKTQLAANRAEDKTLSDALTAYAAFKTTDLPQILRSAMQHRDAVVRAAAAGLLANTAASPETIDVLKKAFISSLLTDKRENDAQLAILDALYKVDKKESVGSLLLAIQSPDYLVRQKAFQLIKAGDFTKDYPGMPPMLASAKRTVQPYAVYTGTRLGQILNTRADYVRAVSRRNAKAIFKTGKGTFTIEFFPEEAPLTVDNFIRLARSGYFNNVSIHRVVPNFVMQDGDPRGDGNGGPGWQIRCEINQIPYERGAVGMALSGKDTGGSQWFVTHSPQPHLDGGYTVFGRVNADGMKVVDNLVRGDKIISVRVVEGKIPVKSNGR